MPKQKRFIAAAEAHFRRLAANFLQVPLHLPEFIWLTTIFLLPLIFWPFAYTSFELPKVILFKILTFLLAAATLVKIGGQKSVNIPALKKTRAGGTGCASRALLFFSGLVLLSWIVSTIFSVAPAVSFFGYYPRFQGLLTWLHYIIFAALVFVGIENRRQIDRLVVTIIASALFVGLLAFLQSFGVSWLNFWDISAFLGRFFGTMGHPDYLGGFLIMVIPLIVIRMMETPRSRTGGKNRLLCLITLVLSLSALYFTLSRGAFIGLFAALIFYLLIAARKTRSKKLFLAAIFAPVILASGLIAVNVFQNTDVVKNNALLDRLVLKGENIRSVETRFALWPSTIQQILQRPWLGYGPDTYAISFPAFAPRELNFLENFGDFPDRAHNVLLDYAVQFGVPALLVFLAFLLLIFMRALRFIFARKGGTRMREDNSWYLPPGLLASILGILAANIFGFFVTVTWVYFWLFMALLFNITAVRRNQHQMLRQHQMLIPVLFVIIAAFGLFSALRDINLFMADTKYREAVMSGDAKKTAQASALAPQMYFYALREAEMRLNSALKLSASAQKTSLDQALAAAEHAGKISADGFYYFTKAKILAAYPDDRAFAVFEQALQKMPTYPLIYLHYGKALLDGGRYAKAAHIFEQYLALSPPYWQWEADLETRSFEDRERYRIFYKLNPDFNRIFDYITEAYRKSGNMEKTREYGQYLMY